MRYVHYFQALICIIGWQVSKIKRKERELILPALDPDVHWWTESEFRTATNGRNGFCRQIVLSVLDHFVGLALKGLKKLMQSEDEYFSKIFSPT